MNLAVVDHITRKPRVISIVRAGVSTLIAPENCLTCWTRMPCAAHGKHYVSDPNPSERNDDLD